MRNIFVCVVCLLAFALGNASQTAFGQALIAPTEPKTPEEERKTFKLPPGFEAQLVAGEPDILKPIQMCFDARGRLWVTTTTEYPFPAVGRPGKDRLVILEDFGPDGKAKKVTNFAENLNIPIGICPLPDGKSALVSSIDPGDDKHKISCWIWKLTDTDGDGKADKFEKLYGPFGVDDTHGMVNSFMLLPDGWVYACHGYRNDSKVHGTDGHTVEMHSGNTYRFRPDGSRIESWTRGQVNPFGLAIDPFFNLYTADCHSRPITQLIAGATYTSFGKPHDGLGFGPDMINHDHGSTALCGLTWYDADQFPAEYKGTMFLGNVVTNRINFDKIEFVGSTPKAIQKPDFLVSGDLWFRPTDIKMGPDGALYVADFYNKIIGHYEVDLKHPGRDRFRGRVWRIVWKGLDGKAPALKTPMDLTKLSTKDLVSYLGNSNFECRLQTLLELRQRKLISPADLPPKHLIQAPMATYLPWLADLLGWDSSTLVQQISDSKLPLEQRVAALRVGNIPHFWDEKVSRSAEEALKDPQPILQRCACEVLAQHPSVNHIAPLLALIAKVPAHDTHLLHAARVALREQFRDGSAYSKYPFSKEMESEIWAVADVSLAIPNKQSAIFIVEHLDKLARKGDRLPEFVGHAVRYGEEAKTSPLMELVRKYQNDNPRLAVLTFQALQRAMQQNGKQLSGDAVKLGEELVLQSLKSQDFTIFQAGVDIAAGLRVARLYEPFEEIALQRELEEARRLAVLPVLGTLQPTRAIAGLGKILMDPQEPIALRERAAQVLASLNQAAAFETLLKAILIVPARLETTIAQGLASSPAGADRLLKAIEIGKASARLLQEKSVQGKLNESKTPNWQARVAALTKGLPSADEKTVALLKNRSSEFTKRKSDAALGQQVFVKNCAACHQMKGQGAKVGPQLDGVGVRGVDRILEDILDPNRNVDQAFRATTLTLKDGKNLMGLFLRQEGQVLVMADEKGKEVRIDQDDIESRRTSLLSPMPANFDQAIPEKEFYELIAYLLSQREKDK